MKTCVSFGIARPLLPCFQACAARRTTPGPESTRYECSFTCIASDGPERAGLGGGAPVPSKITSVFDCAAPIALNKTAMANRSFISFPDVKIAGHHDTGVVRR